MMRKIAGSLGSLFGSKRRERELDEELAFHLEQETEKNVRRGMAPDEARRAALVLFGGVAKTKEESREASRAMFFETLLQDARYGLRSLRRNPGYAAAAILTLALGIGANTAIFSVVHGVLLQSLPYGSGERLVRLRVDAPGAGVKDGVFSPLEVEDLRGRTRTLEAVSEYHSMSFVLLGRPEPERVQTGVVSANFFDLLGVKPILGRTFLPGEDRHGAEAVRGHGRRLRAGGQPSRRRGAGRERRDLGALLRLEGRTDLREGEGRRDELRGVPAPAPRRNARPRDRHRRRQRDADRHGRDAGAVRGPGRRQRSLRRDRQARAPSAGPPVRPRLTRMGTACRYDARRIRAEGGRARCAISSGRRRRTSQPPSSAAASSSSCAPG
jgi:hypothetical protein